MNEDQRENMKYPPKYPDPPAESLQKIEQRMSAMETIPNDVSAIRSDLSSTADRVTAIEKRIGKPSKIAVAALVVSIVGTAVSILLQALQVFVP